MPLAKLPDSSLTRGKQKQKRQVKELYKGVDDGERNVSLARIAGSLCKDGLTLDEVLKMLRIVNSKCNPPKKDSEVIKIANSIYGKEQENSKTTSSFKPEVFTASQLAKEDLPEPSFIVDKILTEGYTFLCGKPKVGKSFLALNLALAIATGKKAFGHLTSEKGEVFYLALEDNKRGLKARLEKMLEGKQFPTALHLATDCQKANEGGLEFIEEWLNKHPKVKLVIVDTLQKFRPIPKGNNITLYGDDYRAVEGLKKISDERNIAILVVHHLRKMQSNDPLDMVSGTTGLTGAADNILILTKNSRCADSDLYITGRNIEEKTLAFRFEKNKLSWVLLGDAEEHHISSQRQKILQVLRDNHAPLSPKKIADVLNENARNIRYLLHEMVKANQVEKRDRGLYTTNYNNTTNNTGNTNIPNNQESKNVSEVSGSSKSTKNKCNLKNNSNDSDVSDESIMDLM